MEVQDGDESIGMLRMIFAAFGTADFERVGTGFVEADEGGFLFVEGTVEVNSLVVLVLHFHRIYY